MGKINVKKMLFLGFMFAFLVMGYVSMQRAMPDAKQDRIYEAIRVYSPYKIEKRVGGLALIDSRTGYKEKPEAAEFFHRLDDVDQQWGKKYLKVENNDVLIMGENNQTIVKIYLETEAEKKWVKTFYGI